jgi:hypothetical protein
LHAGQLRWLGGKFRILVSGVGIVYRLDDDQGKEQRHDEEFYRHFEESQILRPGSAEYTMTTRKLLLTT